MEDIPKLPKRKRKHPEFFAILVVFLLSILAVFCFGQADKKSTARAASPPSAMTYQGKLLENGILSTTTKSFTIKIYDSASGGSELYSLSTSSTPSDGLFSIELAPDPSIFQNDGETFLEVVVEGETLSPRKHLTATPYAFNSTYLNGVGATSTASSSTYIPISDSQGGFTFRSSTITTGTIDYLTVSTSLSVSGTTTLATNGTVGINTTSPEYTLDVYGTTAFGTNTTTHVLFRGYINSDFIPSLPTANALGSPGYNWAYIYAATGTFGGGATTMQIDGNSVLSNTDVEIGSSGGHLDLKGQDFLSLYVDGDERLRVNSLGNVGVGTTTPGEVFTIYASASKANPRLTVKSVSTTQAVGLKLVTDGQSDWEMFRDANGDYSYEGLMFSYNGGSPSVTFASSGYVGIGVVDDPSTLLHLMHPDANQLRIGSDADSYAQVSVDGSSVLSFTTQESGDIVFNPASTGNVYITGGGFWVTSTVGATPTSGEGTKLMWIPEKQAFRAGRVEGSGAAYWDDANIGTSSVAFGLNNKAMGLYSFAMGQLSVAGGPTSIALGDTVEAHGINAIALGTDITVNGDYSLGIGLDGTTYTVSTNNTMSIMGGYVGIGTTTPSTTFVVVGTAGGSDAWQNWSDERLKENVVTIENALSKVQQLRGVEFDWIDPTAHYPGTKIGLIAQDTMSVLPEVVQESGGIYGITYGPITALLIEAIKEQQTQIQPLTQALTVNVSSSLLTVGNATSSYGLNFAALNTTTISFAGNSVFTSQVVATTSNHAFIFNADSFASSNSDDYLLSVRNEGSPQFSISANGDVKAAGTYYGAGMVLGTSTNPGDLAERVDIAIDDTVGPGDVVRIDSESADTYRRSDRAYQQTVAGVISTNPTIIVGNGKTEHTAVMAMVGRVPVKVNSENGQIKRGDLLVSASAKGYAMKYDPDKDPGDGLVAVIGIALESLDRDEGKIMALIRSSWVYNRDQTIINIQNNIEQIASAQGINMGGDLGDLNIDGGGGRITYSDGDLNLNGNLVLNVKAIVGVNNKWYVDSQGNLIQRLATEQGNKEIYGLQSTQKREIVISGSAQLEDGQAEIKLSKIDQEIIDKNVPLKVSITMSGPSRGVYVTEKSYSGFKVQENDDGTSDAKFDWLVIAQVRYNVGNDLLDNIDNQANDDTTPTDNSDQTDNDNETASGGGGSSGDGASGNEQASGDQADQTGDSTGDEADTTAGSSGDSDTADTQDADSSTGDDGEQADSDGSSGQDTSSDTADTTTDGDSGSSDSSDTSADTSADSSTDGAAADSSGDSAAAADSSSGDSSASSADSSSDAGDSGTADSSSSADSSSTGDAGDSSGGDTGGDTAAAE